MTTESGDTGRPISPFHRLLYGRTPRLVVTPALIAAIAAVFAATVVASRSASPDAATLVAWGALSGPMVGTGEWWRLVTATFLHASPLHLGLNALCLWRLGTIVERLLGPPVFLVVYLLTGVLASLASIQFRESSGLSVGASGAVFGIAGVLLAIVVAASGSLRQAFATPITSLGPDLAGTRTEPPPLPPTSQDALRAMLGDLREGVFSFIVYNVLFGFMVPQVDNAAHLGGLAGGVAIGWLVGRRAIAARPGLVHTIAPAVVTVALAAAQIAWLGGRLDVASEISRVSATDARRAETLERALADVKAGRQSAAEAGDALARSVLPDLRDDAARADAVVAAARERVAAATKRDANGRLVYWRQLPGLQYERDRAQAWSDFITVRGNSWQLAIQGLRKRDEAQMRGAAASLHEAQRALTAVLDRPRPHTPD